MKASSSVKAVDEWLLSIESHKQAWDATNKRSLPFLTALSNNIIQLSHVMAGDWGNLVVAPSSSSTTSAFPLNSIMALTSSALIEDSLTNYIPKLEQTLDQLESILDQLGESNALIEEQWFAYLNTFIHSSYPLQESYTSIDDEIVQSPLRSAVDVREAIFEMYHREFMLKCSILDQILRILSRHHDEKGVYVGRPTRNGQDDDDFIDDDDDYGSSECVWRWSYIRNSLELSVSSWLMEPYLDECVFQDIENIRSSSK